MDMTYRQNKIRQAVRNLSATVPGIGEGLWYRPLRENKNYFRYSIDDPEYDVYLETKADRMKWGDLRVEAKVKIFNVKDRFVLPELTEQIFRFNFNGHQPSEQVFLMNVPTYQEKIEDAIEYLAENAVARANND
jgi:hypothetical protein